MAKSFNPGKWERTVRGGPTVLANPASKAGNQFFGLTTISSKTANLHVINAGVVGSTSIIHTQLMQIVATSEPVPSLIIASIYVGSGFVLTTTASWSLLNSYTVAWEVKTRV